MEIRKDTNEDMKRQVYTTDGGVDIRRMKKMVQKMIDEEHFDNTEKALTELWSPKRVAQFMTSYRRSREIATTLSGEYLAELQLMPFDGLAATYGVEMFLTSIIWNSKEAIHLTAYEQVFKNVLEAINVLRLLKVTNMDIPEWVQTTIDVNKLG